MIILAADYGLADDLSWPALELVDQGLVSAVGGVVASPRLAPVAVEALGSRLERIDWGLEFALTEEAKPLSPRPAPALAPGGHFGSLGRLALLAWTKRLPADQVKAELSAQLQAGLDLFGRPPDFLTGLDLVHQFPVIREAVLALARSLPLDQRPWVVNSAEAWRWFKRPSLGLLRSAWPALAGPSWRGRLQAAGLPTNAGFAGFHDRTRPQGYAALLPRCLAGLTGEADLLQVHPGLREDWRRAEQAALAAARPAAVNRFPRPGLDGPRVTDPPLAAAGPDPFDLVS